MAGGWKILVIYHLIPSHSRHQVVLAIFGALALFTYVLVGPIFQWLGHETLREGRLDAEWTKPRRRRVEQVAAKQRGEAGRNQLEPDPYRLWLV